MPCSTARGVEDFDFDMTIQRFWMSATPGDAMRPFFSSQAAARPKGSYNLAGIANPAIDALIEKIMAARNHARSSTVACRAFDRLFRRRPLLGAAMVQQDATGVAYWDQFGHPAEAAARNIAATASARRDLVDGTRRQGGQARAGETIMSAYIARRILLMIPTLLGILFVSFVVVQFAPGGPVERVIAQLSGADTGGTSRISGGGDFAQRAPGQLGAGGDAVNSKYRGAQGLDPDFIKKLEEQFGFDKPAPERFALMVWNFCALRFRQELFPRRQRDPADQGEAAGLDARSASG